jgi:hypothetical protein
MVSGPYRARCLCVNGMVLEKHVYRGIVGAYEEV